MIIVRSPLRISLGGGGTDLPSYYREHGGFVLAGAIDKYVYITVHKTFVSDLIVKYAKLERVPDASRLEHPIIRHALGLLGLDGRGLEITSMADIPAGTGLGSSGSFTTALLKALHTFRKNLIQPVDLAEQACHIELDLLHEPIGRQDQYIAALGGVTCFDFPKSGPIAVRPASLDPETLWNLEDNLVLFFTGYSRSASSILREQDQKTRETDQAMVENLHMIKDLGLQSARAIERGEPQALADLMNVHWEWKKKRSSGMTNPKIDEWYDLARKNGALGGKVVGAGGGGFLLFYAEDKVRLRHAMRAAGLSEVRLRFDFEGTKVVVQS